jgi:hypothetical protein
MTPEQRLAFRASFLKTAIDKGLMKVGAVSPGFSGGISVSPQKVVDTGLAIGNLGMNAVSNTGLVGGSLLLDSSEDSAMARRELEIAMLEEEAEKARIRKLDLAVRALLKRRKGLR